MNLIAHELAHSWIGNLVTNATWNDFWLNKGFTVYFERRIIDKIYGTSYTDTPIQIGYQELQDTLNEQMRKQMIHLFELSLRLS